MTVFLLFDLQCDVHACMCVCLCVHVYMFVCVADRSCECEHSWGGDQV